MKTASVHESCTPTDSAAAPRVDAVLPRLRDTAKEWLSVGEDVTGTLLQEAATVIEYLCDENRELHERDASALIDKWVALYGPIPWRKAVSITAILCQLSDDERERLIALDGP